MSYENILFITYESRLRTKLASGGKIISCHKRNGRVHPSFWSRTVIWSHSAINWYSPTTKHELHIPMARFTAGPRAYTSCTCKLIQSNWILFHWKFTSLTKWVAYEDHAPIATLTPSFGL